MNTNEHQEIGYREEMPWFGGCYHLWLNMSFWFNEARGGVYQTERQCRLCGKTEIVPRESDDH